MKLSEIHRPIELANLLNIPFQFLISEIENPKYTEFTIPKRKGYRKINAPAPTLLKIQKKLNAHLQKSYNKIKPSCVYGFIKNNSTNQARNVIENARVHVNKPYILSMDLKDFFTSIKSTVVRNALIKYIFTPEQIELSTCITLLCSYNSSLPTGAPTSPVLSNLVAIPLDKTLEKLAKKNNSKYTRYADDLTFSLDNYPTEEFISKIRDTIFLFGFHINEAKTRILSQTQKQMVTGIKVNVKPNISRKYYRNIRAMLHDIKINGIIEAAKKHLNVTFDPIPPNVSYIDTEAEKTVIIKFMSILVGRINWVGQVRGTDDFLYLKLRRSLIENCEWLWTCRYTY